MKEIEPEVLNHIPDPLAKPVREKWIAEEKAWLTDLVRADGISKEPS